MHTLFTIGHSTHEFSKFLGLLKQHDIRALADVRSHPFSRIPWFNRPPLKSYLNVNNIHYVFLGNELGARRVERECYVGLRVDYDRIAKTEQFLKGLDRLKVGMRKYSIALMCAERDPLDCHRTILVCRHAKEFADIFHIHGDGHLESHKEAEDRLLSRYVPKEGDLFRSRKELLNEAYTKRGEEIAFVEQPRTNLLDEESLTNEL